MSKIRGFIGRIRKWKKRVFVLILLLLAASWCLKAVRGRLALTLPDQLEGTRWSETGQAAQISCFFSREAAVSPGSIRQMEYYIQQGLEEASVTRESLGIRDAADLFADSWCALGRLTIEAGDRSCTVNAVGTGGNYFLFHPLDLAAGYYYLPDDIMKDRILLDTDTAWKLFGSSDIEGQMVEIQGIPHYVAGVYERETDRASVEAGLAQNLAYVPLECLQKYTEGRYITSAFSDSQEDSGTDAQEGDPDQEADAGSQNDGIVIECYEIVMPSPVAAFAKNIVEDKIGHDSETMKIVDNTARFSDDSLLEVLGETMTRGMQLNAIRYPFWENRARALESRLAILLLIQYICMVIPAVLTVVLVVSWYRGKTWTLGTLVRGLLDRNYEAQARRKQERDRAAEEESV